MGRSWMQSVPAVRSSSQATMRPGLGFKLCHCVACCSARARTHRLFLPSMHCSAVGPCPLLLPSRIAPVQALFPSSILSIRDDPRSRRLRLLLRSISGNTSLKMWHCINPRHIHPHSHARLGRARPGQYDRGGRAEKRCDRTAQGCGADQNLRHHTRHRPVRARQ